MEKKYAGWFVEGAPSLFPSLEDATAWRQTQIWDDGGIGMTPMPEAVPLAHTHVLCGACGRENYPCYLEVCFEVGVVGLERDCPSCVEGYRLSDSCFL